MPHWTHSCACVPAASEVPACSSYSHHDHIWIWRMPSDPMLLQEGKECSERPTLAWLGVQEYASGCVQLIQHNSKCNQAATIF